MSSGDTAPSKYEIITDVPIPDNIRKAWQSTVDLLGEILKAPASLIMRVHSRQIEVLIASKQPNSVYSPGELADLDTGLYCETVMTTRRELHVPDARVDPDWDHNPDIELGMIAYFGMPILWPDGHIFGTLCVLDSEERHFDEAERRLFAHFRDMLQYSLATIHENHQLIREKDIAIRERSEAEVRFAHAQKLEAIGTLAGGIAHDFNNILSAIIGFAEMASITADDPATVRQHLQEVIQAGDRAHELVNQILTFARQTSQPHKPVQLGVIVKETLKLLRASLPTTIEIKQGIESDASVMGDPSQLHQIVMNLCTNAKLAMPNGGTLAVRVAEEVLDEDFAERHPGIRPGRHVRLTVSDTGVGMSHKLQQRIFEPFFSTRKSGEGSGMGLSVVHGIIKDSHGAITVYSEPGEGTTFNVYLPIIDAAEKVVHEEQAPNPTGDERILFVDDEEILCRLAKESLGRLGYRVTATQDSLEALELVKSDPSGFDLVITDMTMPHLTGDHLTEQILGIRSDLPVILSTGFSEKIDAEQARSLGCAGFIAKPLILAKLARLIRDVLDQNS